MTDKPYRPTLPPKAGYVERLIAGEPTYVKVETDETREIERLKSDNVELYAQLVEVGSIDIAKVPDAMRESVTLEVSRNKDINENKIREGDSFGQADINP